MLPILGGAKRKSPVQEENKQMEHIIATGLFGMKVSDDDGKQCRLTFGDNILNCS